MNSKLKKINIYLVLFIIFITGIVTFKIYCNNKGRLNKKHIKLASNENREEFSEEVSLKTLKFVPNFKIKDIKGEEISNKIFRDNKITLINLWGTWNKDCVEELPYIQKLYNEMKDKGVNIIGLVEDSMKNEDMLVNILKKEHIKFMNIVPSEKFYNDFVTLFSTFPSSLIVDSNGRILELISGKKEKSEYESLIDKSLKKF